MTQEASELQFSRKWIKKARVNFKKVNKVNFKVGDNHE